MVLVRRVQPEAPLATSEALHDTLALLGLADDRWHETTQQRHRGDVIFVLCLVFYLIVTLLWAAYWLWLRRSPSASGKLYTALVVVSWGFTSVCINVLNKAVVERTQAPATISAVQMAIAVAVTAPVTTYDLFQVSPRQLGIWLVVPLFYGGAVCTSSFTYEYISLSLYAIVRNMAPLVVLPLERLLMDEARAPKINGMVFLSLLIMVAGALLYVGGIHGFSWLGIGFAVLNLFLAVVDRFIQRRLLTKECKELPTKVCTLVNNAAGILPSLVVSYLTHEMRDARRLHSAAWSNPHNIFLILLSGIAGLAICYFGFECQRVLSVTSFYVMQNVSRVFLVAVGVALFRDPLHSWGSVMGLVLSLVGSFMYGKIQMQAQAESPLSSKLGTKQ